MHCARPWHCVAGVQHAGAGLAMQRWPRRATATALGPIAARGGGVQHTYANLRER